MSEEYTAYADEKEVLLYDGLEFLVLDFQYKDYEDQKNVAHVKLYNLAKHKVPKQL